MLQNLYKIMDIVYPLRNCNICEELAYSLRTLCNLPHNRIFFVGGFPNNIKRGDIVYIPTAQNNTKWKNSLQNIKIACQDERLSEDFILMNDDFFILKPITDKDLSLNQGTLADTYSSYLNRNSSNLYAQGLKETGEYLYSLGVKMPLSFELHIPMVMNKKKVLEIFKLPGINTVNTLQIRSVYGNLYIKNSSYRKDVKVLWKDNLDNIDDTFLSCSDFTWLKIKSFIQERFPEKSQYEF